MDLSENYLDVCNYMLCYPKLWQEHVTFAEKGDERYPFPLSDTSPPVFTLLGEFRSPSYLLIADSHSGDDVLEKATIFTLESLLSGHQVMLDGLGAFQKNLTETLNTLSMAPVLLLRSGFDELFSSFSWLICNHCLYGGGFISPFRPDLVNKETDREVFSQTLSSFSSLVFFTMNSYEYEVALRTLDRGGSIFLHYISLKSSYARSLAKEGAPVVEHIDNSKGYVYKRSDGKVSFLDLRE